MGVIGETWELGCVLGWGLGLMGLMLVGDATEREERLRLRDARSGWASETDTFIGGGGGWV